MVNMLLAPFMCTIAEWGNIYRTFDQYRKIIGKISQEFFVSVCTIHVSYTLLHILSHSMVNYASESLRARPVYIALILRTHSNMLSMRFW